MFIIRIKYRDSIKGGLQSCRVCPMELTTFEFKTFASHYALENEWACVFHALTQCSLLIFCDSLFCSYCFHVILAMILGFAEGVRSAEEALAVATKACVVCGLDIDVNDMPPEMEGCKEPLELLSHTFSVKMCVPTTSKKTGMLVSFFHSQQVFRSLGVGNF